MFPLARHVLDLGSGAELGILAAEKRGASKDYRVDETCPIAPELRSIVRKTEDDGRRVKGKLRSKEKQKVVSSDQ